MGKKEKAAKDKKKNKVAKKEIKKAVKKVAAPKKEVKKTVKKVTPKAVAKKAAPKVAKKVVKKAAVKKVAPKVVKKAAPKVVKKTAPKVIKKEVKKVTVKKEVIKPVKKEVKIVAKVKPEIKKEEKKVAKKENVKKEVANTTDFSDNKIRYSDKELMEFREIILKKLEEAKRDLALLTEAYTTKNDHDTNDTSPTFKVLEEGSNVLSKEENSQLALRQQKFIRDLESALLRIDNKTYGICRVTGKLIPKERLKVVPHATMSIEAKLMTQKQKS
jgi:RNA polymerase-binding transcription factor DksA